MERVSKGKHMRDGAQQLDGAGTFLEVEEGNGVVQRLEIALCERVSHTESDSTHGCSLLQLTSRPPDVVGS
jgi:hypothetical protein